MTHKYDFLVIGSGIAGMSFALKVAAYGKVAIFSINLLEDTNSHALLVPDCVTVRWLRKL